MADLTVSTPIDTFMQASTALGAAQALNLLKKGSDVASASTINLSTTTGDVVDVTGTTTITAVTLAEGKQVLVRFTGALTLTHGANLVLPGAANITTAAGDYALFVGYASSVVRVAIYQKSASVAGDTNGPSSATDEAVARFDGTTGKLLQNSVVTITDAGAMSGVTQLNADNLRLDGNTLSSTDTNGNINLTPNGTGQVVAASIQASGAGGVDLKNSGGTSVILAGAGAGTGVSIAGTTNIASASADYHQVAGGTGTITDTATGSSTNININLVPKGTGRLQANAVNVPTISSSDTLTNKTLDAGTAVTASISWGDGIKQTFNPNGTNAGLNVGSHSADPSSAADADLVYNTTLNALRARINGAWVSLGAGGGGSFPTPATAVKTDTASTSSATFADLTGLTVSVTPTATNQKILVMATVFMSNGTAATLALARLAQDGTVLTQGDAASSRSRTFGAYYEPNATNGVGCVALCALVDAGTTSSTTFSVQWASSGSATIYLNRTPTDSDSATYPRCASSITVMPFPV